MSEQVYVNSAYLIGYFYIYANSMLAVASMTEILSLITTLMITTFVISRLVKSWLQAVIIIILIHELLWEIRLNHYYMINDIFMIITTAIRYICKMMVLNIETLSWVMIESFKLVLNVLNHTFTIYSKHNW